MSEMAELSKLQSLLSEATATVKHVASEREKANQVASYLKKLHVGYDEYGNRRVNEVIQPFADRINAEIKAGLTAEVERQFQDDLRARSLRLEAIRAVVCSLAAKASIEIGEEARRLAREADAALNPTGEA